MSDGFFRAGADGVRLLVRLTPKAGREAIGGVRDGRLKVSVTAVPEKGKANAALVKLLAKRLKVAKSDLEIVSGESDRNKVLLIRADAVEDALKALI